MIAKPFESLRKSSQLIENVRKLQNINAIEQKADRLLGDVFSNIIGNSIKHSCGPVIITISLKKVRKNNKKYLKIVMDDNGPGIVDDMKKKLFMRFQRGNTRASGKGLGLYLVRTLVENYRGKVWAEDRVPGDHTKGARFIILLPGPED